MKSNIFTQLLCHRSILPKALLTLCLILSASSQAWGVERNITVNDSESLTTNYHFPFYGGFANKSPLASQYIIPKGDLEAINNNTITKIVLYFAAPNKNWGDARFKVYLKEIDNDTFESSPTLIDEGLTEVYSGELTVNSDSKMEITLSNGGFEYKGNNLLISFNSTATGGTTGVSCYVKNNGGTSGKFSNIAYQYVGLSGTVTYGEKYLPKMTLYYSVGGTPTPTNFTSSNISYDSATLSWNAGDEEDNWQIKYNAESDFDPNSEGTMANDDPVTDNPYLLEGLDSETTYFAYIRAYIDPDNQSDWVGPVSFTTPEQYPTPTDFALDSFTATTATFSWTNGAGTEATVWQIKYSTTKGFNPDATGTSVNSNSNPYTLEGLSEGTTYYARIRADYGNPNYSSWNETEVEFTPSNTINTLINNGTDKSYNVPIQGSSVSSSANLMVKSQFIIPSSSLTEVQNRQITKLTFYAENNSSINWGTATFEVYLREVSYTTFATTSFESWGTKVFNSASLSVSDNEMSIILDTPFNYINGNLQIGIKQTGTGSNSSTTWLSVKDGGYANLALYGTGTGSTGTRTYYAPKMTITSVPATTAPVQIGANGYTTFVSHLPLDLSESTQTSLGLTAYKAASIESDIVRFTAIDQNVQEYSGVLLEGTAGQTYMIPVAESGTAIDGNAFLVRQPNETITPDDDYTYFGMKKATESTDPLKFAKFNPSTVAIPTDKAYLKVLTSSLPSGARELTFVFDEEGGTTVIQSIDNGKMAIDNYYDLQGRRVANSQLKSGMYIVNGKKLVIK